MSAVLQWLAVGLPGVVECVWFVEIAAVSAVVAPVLGSVFYDDACGGASKEPGYRRLKRMQHPSLRLQEARLVLHGWVGRQVSVQTLRVIGRSLAAVAVNQVEVNSEPVAIFFSVEMVWAQDGVTRARLLVELMQVRHLCALSVAVCAQQWMGFDVCVLVAQ